MEVAFDPKQEVLRLLDTAPRHPWAALIPQVVLWCFRRFCLEKLILFEGTLGESLPDDLLELVHAYAPKGLEVVSIEWFTPENIDEVATPLEEYMSFFVKFCSVLDASIEAHEYETQDMLSDFLDESMSKIVCEWLDEKHKCFLIFPTTVEQDDQFSEAQFSKLINALLMYSYAQKVPESSPPSLLWQLIPLPQNIQLVYPEVAEPEAQPEAQPEVQPEAQPEVQPEVQPEAQPEAQPPKEIQTLAQAIHRRRTLCVKGRRAQQPRVKTRKTHPAPYTKEEV